MEEERKKTETEVEVEYIQVQLPPPLHAMMKIQDTLEKGFSLDATADKI